MNVMKIDLLEHNELNENKLYQKVFVYTLIVVLFIVLCIIILFGVRKKIYYLNNMYIGDKNIVTNVLINDLDNLTSNHTMFINKKEYTYQIEEIELINDSTSYYRVYLKINGYEEEGNILNYKIYLRNDSLFNYLIFLIGGSN